MRRILVVAVLVVTSACSGAVLGGISTTSPRLETSTTSIPATTTTTTQPGPMGSSLVKYDLDTFVPVPGLKPIPMGSNSWTISSEDGDWMAIFEYVGDTLSTMTGVSVAYWVVTGTYDGLRHSARVVGDGTLYLYDDRSGGVSSLDLNSGELDELGGWPTRLVFWDELHTLPDGRVIGLGSKELGLAGVPDYSVFWLDPGSGQSGEIEIGVIERTNFETGIFEGQYEIPESDWPAVVWAEDRLYLVHADGPDVTAVDLETGEVAHRPIETMSWLDRLLAFWVPTASAKGAVARDLQQCGAVARRSILVHQRQSHRCGREGRRSGGRGHTSRPDRGRQRGLAGRCPARSSSPVHPR